MRDNNFDLLRLVFAAAVFFWHIYALSRAPELAVLGAMFSADFPIKGFFVISGFLVTMSYENSASLRDYAAKRVRRIYPAYAAVVIACAVAGAIVSVRPLAEYLGADLLRYLAANLVFLNFLAPTLPGVFEGQPHSEVNGALWTLKIEVMYYASVPAIAWLMSRLGRWRVLVALYVLSVAYTFILGELHARTGALIWLQLQRQLPGQMVYFLAGAALFFLGDRLRGRWLVLFCTALVTYGASAWIAHPAIALLLEPAALGLLVIGAATALPHLGNFARYGDFSYGIYIIHFLVLQVLIAAGLFEAHPWAGSAAALALVVALAALNWHAVERPFLRRRSHYRLAENRSAADT